MKKVISFLLALLLGGSAFAQEQPVFVDPMTQEGFPVTLRGDTLFHVVHGIGAFTAADRAHAISKRLEEVARDRNFTPDSLLLVSNEREVRINYLDRTLMVVRHQDTTGTGLSPDSMAVFYRDLLKEELKTKSDDFLFIKILKDIGYTALVILVLILIIYLLNRLFRLLHSMLEKRKDRLFRSIRINNYEFLNIERQYTLSILILKTSKIALVIIVFLVALPVIFAIFPATEGITRKIIDLVWDPVRNIIMSVMNYIPKMVTIVIIFIVFRYLVRFTRFLAGEIERKALVIPGFHPDWSKPTFNIIRILLYAFMFIIIFPYLPGSDSPVFRGVSVFLGVLLSLGSTSLISNTIAGIVITYMRPYRVGDRIKMDDIIGTVTEKSLMITRIRTTKNELVTVPNSKILTGYTVNYTVPAEGEGLIIYTSVTIGYDAPWRTVHSLLLKAAARTRGVVGTPAPFVLQTSLDDFYVSYQVNAYIKDASEILAIKSELHQNIQDEFNTAGVEIMSPHYRSERDGNEVTIPKSYRPGDPIAGPSTETNRDNPAEKS